MKYRFGVILTILMVGFAAVISLAMSGFDYLRFRESVIESSRDPVRQAEAAAAYALETVEKAYYYFGETIAKKMEEASYSLSDLYDQQPSFAEWDFAALKERFSSDIYIIDEQNVVVYSSFPQDVGLDFKECCPGLSKRLQERRLSGGFFHDGIDIEQKTGKLKKYSYLATRDHKFLIQLGYYFEDDEIFKPFNFLDAIDQFVQLSNSVLAVRVYNTGGYLIGGTLPQAIPDERRPSFERVLQTGEPAEKRGEWRQEPAVYRYVPYTSRYDQGAAQKKVIEIVYTDKNLQKVLKENKNWLLAQIFVVLLSSAAAAYAVTRWLAKPLHLAYHDSLTGLQNRAALDRRFARALSKTGGTAAVLMIDLDNFKRVNDLLGHDRGDRLLKDVANAIRRTVRKKDHLFRLGGDEFVLLLPSAGREEAERTAAALLAALTGDAVRTVLPDGEAVTASIGIALYPEHGRDQETLLKQADRALYASKEKGKNRYRFCD